MIAFFDSSALIYTIVARSPLRMPDALQAACCLQLRASHLFLTGDRAFERVAGLEVEVMA